jgi:hypothetical protein
VEFPIPVAQALKIGKLADSTRIERAPDEPAREGRTCVVFYRHTPMFYRPEKHMAVPRVPTVDVAPPGARCEETGRLPGLALTQ